MLLNGYEYISQTELSRRLRVSSHQLRMLRKHPLFEMGVHLIQPSRNFNFWNVDLVSHLIQSHHHPELHKQVIEKFKESSPIQKGLPPLREDAPHESHS